jgi:hypothetical protein
MPLPTLDKTWAFSVNNVCGNMINRDVDGQDAIYKMINALIAAGWVVVGSCDSLAYGNNDGVNRITAANKFVFGYGGAQVKSWIILKNAALAPNAMMCLWGETWGAGGGAHELWFSTTGFGTAYGGTDGTTLLCPGGAAATTWKIYQGSLLWSNNAMQCTMHVMYSSDLECTRVIFTDASIIPSGIVIGYLAMEKAKEPSAAWTVPVFVTCVGNWVTYNNGQYLIPGQFGNGTFAGSKMGGTLLNLQYTGEGTTNKLLCENTGLVTVDDASTGWPFFPVGLCCPTVGHRNWKKGKVYDLWWGSVGVLGGDTYPTTVGSKRKFVQINQLIFPWDGLVTPDGTPINLS